MLDAHPIPAHLLDHSDFGEQPREPPRTVVKLEAVLAPPTTSCRHLTLSLLTHDKDANERRHDFALSAPGAVALIRSVRTALTDYLGVDPLRRYQGDS